MSLEPETRCWEFAAGRDAPRLARDAVCAYATAGGARDGVLGALKLCVSEAVTNAVVHGYRDGDARGRVMLRAQRVLDRLHVIVRDNGCGLVPRPDSPGAGLGLPMIAQLAHGLEIRVPEDGGTEVSMRFKLDAED
jgi:anti-sigma regulatory factor (Ser/Thr protein kinase)